MGIWSRGSGLIGFVEVTIFILAISQVVRNVGNVWNVLSYSGGFATGTMLGMWLEEKMATVFSAWHGAADRS
jgi:uncharacterized protein YebE (UPF0316 family)